jgi:hypothetical protein
MTVLEVIIHDISILPDADAASIGMNVVGFEVLTAVV